MNDDQYAQEYSGLCAADRAVIAALADSAEQDDMDRFQDPSPESDEAEQPVDLPRDQDICTRCGLPFGVLEMHIGDGTGFGHRYAHAECYRGGYEPGGQEPDNGWAYRITVDFDMKSKLEAQMLADIVRISVRKHIDGDARVTFEAHEAVGSEALLPRFQHPSYSGLIVNP